MVGDIAIFFGVLSGKTQSLAHALDILGLASQKGPAFADLKILHVAAQRCRIVLQRRQGNRIEMDVVGEIAKQLMRLPDVLRHRRTDVRADRVHEVNHHLLVFKQVVVEPHLFASMREQRHVGKALLAQLLTRVLLQGGCRGGHGPVADEGREGSAGTEQQTSFLNIQHDIFSRNDKF